MVINSQQYTKLALELQRLSELLLMIMLFCFLLLGMTDLQRKLKHVDCILEVHDARVSFCEGKSNQTNLHF